MYNKSSLEPNHVFKYSLPYSPLTDLSISDDSVSDYIISVTTGIRFARDILRNMWYRESNKRCNKNKSPGVVLVTEEEPVKPKRRKLVYAPILPQHRIVILSDKSKRSQLAL